MLEWYGRLGAHKANRCKRLPKGSKRSIESIMGIPELESRSSSESSVQQAQQTSQTPLAQVREILFGEQVRLLEQKMEEMMGRLDEKVQAIQKDLQSELKNFQRSAEEQFHLLSERLLEEAQAREIGSRDLENALKDTGIELHRQLDKLANSTEKNLAGLKADKADRKDLAKLLSGVAEKLLSEVVDPSSDGKPQQNSEG